METLTRLPWAAKSAVFKKLEEIADVSKLSREEREKYDVGLRKYRDTISVLEGAHMDGFAEGDAKGFKRGRAKGRAEGRAEGEAISKRTIAKAMISKGLDLNLISAVTGLSSEEILS